MSTRQEHPQPATDPAYAKRMAQELERIAQRRGASLGRPKGQEACAWGLCLSGGGIRSATFCLGVLQALSRAPAPDASATASPGAGDSVPAPESSLLGQIDYLSTVSGGGYIGTFFSSLFLPGRADQGANAAASAANAYNTLRVDPPPRLHAATISASSSARRAMCWLRENGRYMAPSSAGDLLYGAAVVLRAWLGMHLVLGLLLLLLLALLNVGKNGLLLAANSSHWSEFIVPLSMPGGWISDVWLSGLWLFPVLVLLLMAVPCGCAYWMTYPPAGDNVNAKARQSARYWVGYSGSALAVALAMAGSAGMLGRRAGTLQWNQTATPFAAVLAGMLLAALWFLLSRGDLSFGALRVRLTRQLTMMLKLAGVLAFLALVDSLAQSIYLHNRTVVAPLTAAGVITWLVRRLAPQLKGLPKVGRGRVPLEVLLTFGAVLLAVLLVTVWDYGVIWLQWQGEDMARPHFVPSSRLLQDQCKSLGLLLGATAALTLMIGRYPQFLNLSSLQNLYSARLTRAYQGASNAERFAKGGKFLSSAEPIGSDHISHAAYNQNPFAPLHIINICLNQNVDPAEQLIQRDRKGRPMAVLPGVAPAPGAAGAAQSGLPFAIDGKFNIAKELGSDDTLTIGEWIGVSGAAAATGSGRRTSAALALLLGLANVRLGRWWRSGLVPVPTEGVERHFRALLPTQAYLADELGARFYGTRRPLHYLSDGGHFDNTGIYELLRAERHVNFVIACDCGADPGYRFDDLANLIRMARIDFGVEIDIEESVTSSLSQLRDVFGTPEELASPQPGSNKCAMLLNVFRTPEARRDKLPSMRIVLVKPALIAGAPLDVHNYRAENKDFPQQTTGDQFFDEAQWESYRKLGLELGRQIFDSDNDQHRQQLWKALLA
jgi:hypothetical protein